MNHKYVNITVSLILFLSIMIPSVLISQYFYLILKKNSISNAYNIISRVREEKTKQVRSFFNQEVQSFDRIINNMTSAKAFPLDKDVRYILDSQPNIKQVVLYDYNFEPIVVINRNRSANIEDIPERIRLTIQSNFYFSSYFFSDISMPDGSSDLVFFYKDTSRDRYYSITLDYKYLNTYLKELGHTVIDIYNDKYQIVASSRKTFDSRRVHITPLTEKLILGLTENVQYKGSLNSFSHIEIGNEKLFINVNLPKKVIDSKNTYIKYTLFFFYIIFSLGSLLVGTLLVRFFYHVKESSIRKELFSNRFSFFHRIKKTIVQIDEKYLEVQRLYKCIQYLKNDVSTILDELMLEDNDEAKKNK